MHFENSRGQTYTPLDWLTFNDVLLKPQKSRFKSRNDENISVETNIGKKVNLNIPIISANMDTITGSQMAIAMHNLGGLGILHRFYTDLDRYKEEICRVYNTCGRVAFSVGCDYKWINFIKDFISSINLINKDSVIVCLDVAHGHMLQSLEMVKNLSELDVFIIAGNTATPEGALDLATAGANAIKIGIGSGSICSTRIVTGHGVPQLSAIMNARESLDRNSFQHIGVIADGGIRNSGDIVKAIAAGADAVMIGSLLAGCVETPGEIFKHQDGSYKIYRGQSSRHFLKDIGKDNVASEGEVVEVRTKGPVSEIINEYVGGIRSGLTYSGAANLPELKQKAVFMEISHHGWIESTPHAITRLI